MGNVVTRCSHPDLATIDDSPPQLSLLASTATGSHGASGNAADQSRHDTTSSIDELFLYQTPTERQVLKRHREGRPNHQLLDPTSVTIAHLEQAEELLQREHILRSIRKECAPLSDDINLLAESSEESGGDPILNHNDDDSSTGGVFSNLTDTTTDTTTSDGSSSKLEGLSMATHTVLTSVTATTKPICNTTRHRAKCKSPCRRSNNATAPNTTAMARYAPSILDQTTSALLVPTLQQQRLIQEQLNRALSVTVRSRLGKAYQCTRIPALDPTKITQENGDSTGGGSSSNNTTILARAACGVAQADFSGGWWSGGWFGWNTRDERTLETSAREHMNVLYLKMHSKCAQYSTYQQLHEPQSLRPLSDANNKPVLSAITAPPLMGRFRLNLRSPAERQSNSRTNNTRLSSGSNLDALLSSNISPNSNSGNDQSEAFASVGPPSNPVRLLVTDAVFLDLALTGSLGLVTHRSESAAATAAATKLFPPERHKVLFNRRSGIPLAVCVLKSGATARGNSPIMQVLATKRRFHGQKAVSTTRELGLDWSSSLTDSSTPSLPTSNDSMHNLPLFPWAEIVTEGSYPSFVRYSTFLVTGNEARLETDPSYVAVHESLINPEIAVIGRTEREVMMRRPYGTNARTGCAVLSLSRDDDLDDSDVYLRLSVSKGVDLVVLLCWAALVDESIESALREFDRSEAIARKKCISTSFKG